MYKIFKNFILNASDIGEQSYSAKEIAEKMKDSGKIDDSSLYEFANMVSCYMETNKRRFMHQN